MVTRYALKLPKKVSDSSKRKEARDAKMVFVGAVDGTPTRKWSVMLDAPPPISTTYMFLLQIKKVLSNRFKDPLLFEGKSSAGHRGILRNGG